MFLQETIHVKNDFSRESLILATATFAGHGGGQVMCHLAGNGCAAGGAGAVPGWEHSPEPAWNTAQAAAFISCPQNTNLSCSQPMFPSEQQFLALQSIFYPRYFYPLCVVFLIAQEFFSLRLLRIYPCRAGSWSGCQTVMSATNPGMRRIHFSLLESHERVPQQLRICEAALKCSQTNPERRAGIPHRYL